MTTVSQFCRAVAGDKEELKELAWLARVLRDADVLPKAGRGLHAAHLGTEHAAIFLLGRMVGQPKDATKAGLFSAFLPDQREGWFHLAEPAVECLQEIYYKLRNDVYYSFGKLFYDLIELGRQGHDFGVEVSVIQSGWWREGKVRFGRDEIVVFKPSDEQDEMFDHLSPRRLVGLRMTHTTTCWGHHFIAVGQALGDVAEEHETPHLRVVGEQA